MIKRLTPDEIKKLHEDFPVAEEGGDTQAIMDTSAARGRGRPITRNDEAAMFLVWEMVMIEWKVHGAKGVEQACKRLMRRRIVIDWLDPARKKTVIANSGTLRQRFYAAEAARMDAASFPILSQRCAAFIANLPNLVIRHRAMRAYVAALKRLNIDPSAITGIGAVPKVFQELHTLDLALAKKSQEP